MIKRIISFLIISVLILQCPAVILASPEQTPENLFRGGDFESFSEGTIEGWTLPADTALDTNGVDGGTTALKVVGRGQTTAPAPTNKLTYQYNRTYEFKFYARADEADLQEGNTFYWYLDTGLAKPSDNTESGWPDVSQIQALNTDGSWTLFTKTLKFVPAGSASQDATDFSSHLVCYEKAAAGNTFTPTVYFDDFSVTPVYVIDSIDISGANTIVVPDGSTPNTADYSGTILNREGNSTEMPGSDIITWSLKSPVTGVSISSDGMLSVDSTATPETTVTIVASATEYGVDAIGELNVTLSPYISDQDMVDATITELESFVFTDENHSAITHSLNSLPSTGVQYPTTITWESLDDTVMSDEGAIVAAPPYGNLNVTMRATVSMNGTSDTADFPFTLLANSNFVVNSSFEDGSLTPWVNEGLAATQVTDTPHSGSKCAKLTNLTQSYYTLKQDISVPNNNEYIYSVWVRVPETTDITNASFTLGARPTGTAKNHLTSVSVPANNQWTRISAPYTHLGTAGEYSTINIYLFLYTTGLTEYYMDDFSVEPLKADVVKVVGQDGIRLPGPGSTSVSRKFTTDITDQLDRPLTPNSVRWSVRAKNGGSISGVSVDNDGNLTINSGAAPQTVILSAAVTYNGLTTIGEKEIEILQYLDEAAAVKTALASLTEASILAGGDTTTAEIRNNLSFPTSYSSLPGVTPDYVVSFDWVSDNESVVKADGTIVRDDIADKTAVITVTAKLGEKSESKQFTVTVKRIENLLDDPTFESNSAAAWSIDNTTGTLAVSADAKRTGEYGLKVSGGNAVQTLSRVKYGRMYHFTGYMKSGVVVNALLESSKGEMKLASAAANTSDFEKMDIVFEYTGEDNPKLIIGADGAEFFMDDLAIADVTDAFTQAGEAVIKAEESCKAADKAVAESLVSKLPACPLKTRFEERISEIDVGSSGSGSSGAGSNYNPRKTSFSVASQAVPEIKPVKPILADINGHWAETEIVFLFNKGIVNGSNDGNFYPDNNITRAEFAAMMVRMLGVPVETYGNVFNDVKSEDWYSGVVQTIYNNGIMSGHEGYFRPNDKITREEMAVSVMRAYELKNKAEAEITVSEDYFKDTNDMSEWSKNSIFKAVSLELINGTGNQLFKPSDFATRAQVAVLIKRLYERSSGNA